MAHRMGVDADTRQEFQLPTGQGVRDVWREIFDYLSDPKDFVNLLLASPEYFEPLLEDRKSALLFPLALKVLDRRDYIPKSTTLECRLVSKIAKSSVDKWIRDGNPCLENLEGWVHDTWDPKHDMWHCWKPVLYEQSQWQKHVGNVNTNSNPFLNGYVTLDLTSRVNGHPRLLQDFRVVLANFGNQIRYFHFLAKGPFEECFEILRGSLVRMPNLRSLHIVDYSEAYEENLNQCVIVSTLPNLTDLSTLHSHMLPSILLLSVVMEKYGSQLNKLLVDGLSQSNFHRLPLGYVGNLQHVSLPGISQSDEALGYVNPTREWWPTLETLSVNVDAGSIEPIFTKVLAALENCFGSSRSLKNLNIHLLGPSTGSEYFTSQARLLVPSLKRLWIHCEDCCPLSIDFILGLQETLEEFTLDMFLDAPSEVEEEFRFTRLVERMYDSKMWDQMVKLERITIRKKILGQIGKPQVYSYGGRQELRISAGDRMNGCLIAS